MRHKRLLAEEINKTISHDMKPTQESVCQEKELLIRLRNQKKTGTLCDIVFVHEEFKLYSHACVLASCSPYMKQLINTHLVTLWGIKTPLSISLTDIIKQHENVCFKCFENIIDFMYTSNLHVDRDHLKHVEYAANLLQINDLIHTCIQLSEKERNYKSQETSCDEKLTRQKTSMVLRNTKTQNTVNLKHGDNSIKKCQSIKQNNLKSCNKSKLSNISVGTLNMEVNTYKESSEGNLHTHVDVHDTHQNKLNGDENVTCQKAEHETSCNTQLRTNFMAETCNNILLSNEYVGTGNSKNMATPKVNKSKKEKCITSVDTENGSVNNCVCSNSHCEKSNITTRPGTIRNNNNHLPLLRCSVPTCNFTTTRNSSLMRHTKVHVLICYECKISFPNENAFSQHLSEIHSKHLSKIKQKIVPIPGITQFKCNECGYSTSKEKLFIRHAKKWHTVSKKTTVNKPVNKTINSVINFSHANSSLQLPKKNCKINSVKANSEESFLQNVEYNNNADNNIKYCIDTILQDNNEQPQSTNNKNEKELLSGGNTQQAEIINYDTWSQPSNISDELLTYNLNDAFPGLYTYENMNCLSSLTSGTAAEQLNYADFQSVNYTDTYANLNDERTSLNSASTMLQPEEIYNFSSLKYNLEEKSYDLLSFPYESEFYQSISGTSGDENPVGCSYTDSSSHSNKSLSHMMYTQCPSTTKHLTDNASQTVNNSVQYEQSCLQINNSALVQDMSFDINFNEQAEFSCQSHDPCMSDGIKNMDTLPLNSYCNNLVSNTEQLDFETIDFNYHDWPIEFMANFQ